MRAASISEGGNPAADRGRMWLALGVLTALGLLSWFTLDGSAVLPVHEYSFGSFTFGGFGMKIRWIPELILGLFAVRVVTANMRARLESAASGGPEPSASPSPKS